MNKILNTVFFGLLATTCIANPPLCVSVCNGSASTRWDYGDPILPSNEVTVCLWVRACASNRDIMGNSGGITNDYGFEVRVNYEDTLSGEFGVTQQAGIAGDNWSLQSTSIIPSNAYAHCAFTWDGTTNADAVIVYFDGVQEATTTATVAAGPPGTYGLSLCDDQSGSGNFHGYWWDVRAYDRVLSANEILAIKQTRGKDAIYEGLVFRPMHTGAQVGQSLDGGTCYDQTRTHTTSNISGGAAAPIQCEGGLGRRYAYSY